MILIKINPFSLGIHKTIYSTWGKRWAESKVFHICKGNPIRISPLRESLVGLLGAILIGYSLQGRRGCAYCQTARQQCMLKSIVKYCEILLDKQQCTYGEVSKTLESIH